jgi:hypothetical protein
MKVDSSSSENWSRIFSNLRPMQLLNSSLRLSAVFKPKGRCLHESRAKSIKSVAESEERVEASMQLALQAHRESARREMKQVSNEAICVHVDDAEKRMEATMQRAINAHRESIRREMKKEVVVMHFVSRIRRKRTSKISPSAILHLVSTCRVPGWMRSKHHAPCQRSRSPRARPP